MTNGKWRKKPEIRSTISEAERMTGPSAELRSIYRWFRAAGEFRISSFGLPSDFDIRISDFLWPSSFVILLREPLLA